MADGLNMGGMTLKDSNHAPPPGQQSNGTFERSAYVPPHMRRTGGGPPPAAAAPNGFGGPGADFPPPGQKYVLIIKPLLNPHT